MADLTGEQTRNDLTTTPMKNGFNFMAMADQEMMSRKKLIVSVELVGDKAVRAMELMYNVKQQCGALVACRHLSNKTFEVTMSQINSAIDTKYFRVLHDKQFKTCHICMQPGHIQRECPELLCHRCGVHYARECSKNVIKCKECGNVKDECSCSSSEKDQAQAVIYDTTDGEDRMQVGDEQVAADGAEQVAEDVCSGGVPETCPEKLMAAAIAAVIAADAGAEVEKGGPEKYKGKCPENKGWIRHWWTR